MEVYLLTMCAIVVSLQSWEEVVENAQDRQANEFKVEDPV